MDYTSATSENESISEVETLRQQLNTYKMINADLSKKIQQLKAEQSAIMHENAEVRRQMLDERAKAAEYRQFFSTMNTHCINFINTYVNSMQEIHEKDDSFINGIPGIVETPRSGDEQESPQNLTIVAQIQKPQRSTHRHEDDDAGCNVLNTILEESCLPFTSTPIVHPRHQGISNSAPQFVNNNNLSPPTPISHKNLLETPKTENSDPAQQNSANLSSSSSTSFIQNDVMKTPINQIPDIEPTNDSFEISNISQTVAETPKLRATHSSRRISIVPEDEIEEYPDLEKNTYGDDTTEETVQDETVKKIKEKRVALSPLKNVHLKSNNNNNTNTESPDYESFEDESTIGKSQESQSTSRSTRALKRKNSESGRPRRQARPDAKSLKEPSLRVKMRRSKKKT